MTLDRDIAGENDLHRPEPAGGEIRKAHVARFRKLARQMATLLEEIREDCPGANMYLEDSGNWILLAGESHDHVNGRDRARQDRKVAMEIVPHSGGGAW